MAAHACHVFALPAGFLGAGPFQSAGMREQVLKQS
jgi:hypothetical protein